MWCACVTATDAVVLRLRLLPSHRQTALAMRRCACDLEIDPGAHAKAKGSRPSPEKNAPCCMGVGSIDRLID